jgi:UDP-galactopyranose mutase
MYDYLIVGAGLFGAVCARDLTDAGKRVLVVERAGHVAGMCHTVTVDGLLTQAHGGHIFHTNSREIWDYVNRFGAWRAYSHHVKASYQGTVYSFPPNKMTYQQLGTDDPGVIRRTFFEGYTAKQWGRPIEQVPADVLKRIPLRTTWDDHYFSDTYQALPVDGYTAVIGEMLSGVKVVLGEDYLARCHYWDSQARRTLYTGPMDALMGYQLGKLEYRSARFETETLPVEDFQGCATMNYTDAAVPFTRIEEWRHWWKPARPVAHTVITRTYPTAEGLPLYPVNDGRNQDLYSRYQRLAAGHKPQVRTGGRLGSYIYRDMAPTIAAAQTLVKQELG